LPVALAVHLPDGPVDAGFLGLQRRLAQCCRFAPAAVSRAFEPRRFALRAPTGHSAVAGKSGRRAVSAFIATALARDKPEAESTLWRGVDNHTFATLAICCPNLEKEQRSTCERCFVFSHADCFMFPRSIDCDEAVPVGQNLLVFICIPMKIKPYSEHEDNN
jgi:hypothetical protein